MVAIKYSVGTANKFGGLDIDTDSSEDETINSKMPSQLSSSSSPPTLNNSIIFSTDKSSSLEENLIGKKSIDVPIQQNNQVLTSLNSSIHPIKGKSKYIATSSETIPNSIENSQTGRFKGNPSEKFGKFKVYEKSNEKAKSKREGVNQNQSTELVNSSNNEKNEISKIEEKPQDDKSNEKDKILDSEESKKQTLEQKSSDPIMMDLEEWKSKQATKRANLPTASNAKIDFSNFTTQLEAQGLKRYVKASESKASDPTINDQSNENTIPKKKSQTVNYHELIYNATGHVKLFPVNKGRGGRRNPSRGYKSEKGEKEKHIDYKERDAPDFQDTRAFPTLGDAKVAS